MGSITLSQRANLRVRKKSVKEGSTLNIRKWRRQEKSELSKFFFGKTKANKEIKTPPGAATVALHAHLFFSPVGLRLP